jgi:mRNA interferase HicA
MIVMNGNELLRKLKRLAREQNMRLELIKKHGKGSHGTLYYGEKKTTLKDRKKEIGKGLLKSMLDDLGLVEGDL